MESKKKGSGLSLSSSMGEMKREQSGTSSARAPPPAAAASSASSAVDLEGAIEDFTLGDVMKPLYFCSLPGGQLAQDLLLPVCI
jgi:hypothetical protein